MSAYDNIEQRMSHGSETEQSEITINKTNRLRQKTAGCCANLEQTGYDSWICARGWRY